ncbi:two-component system OmpR family sensor kinase [Arthrobacter sp. V4I6]|uniref:sensor histidine kinase n=1 Tax=unclassified Arthrobacter TaxID=235627 RepID=UPI00278B473E|nr:MULTISPECIES: HAMP domain-containing sensor histidine kinase [unclassified Arthrobacter]MDQ0819338.1 two-component system OmpR family sensor kinase [Arthrobacter sp. V1I7]MDQ0853522.1 two-component system OmpR family sensor kinase [Arthrobacter sp. V4I6]
MTATLSRLRESARAARATPPAPPPGGNLDKQGWSARAHSVRFRVVAAMLLMMLAGLVVAGLISFAVQFQDSDARVDQALLDKAHAVVKLVPSKDRSEREALERGLHEAAEDIEPRSNEVMAGITDGKVKWTVDGSSEENLLNEDRHPAAVALTGAPDAAFGDFAAQGRPFRAVVVPVKGAPGPVTYLLVGRDTGDLQEQLVSSIHTYVLVAAGTLLAAAILGGTVAGRLLYPLRRLREATQVVSPEDMTKRVEVRNGADDVTLLMKTFNTMLERLDEGAQEQQKFLDDAGHELRTPLTILRGHLELVSVDDPADVTATRDMLLEEVDRMQRLVDDLLLLANAGRPDFLRKQPVRFPEFLHQVMEKVHVLADRHWQLDETADSVLDADPQRLTQALVQLAANAVKYTGPSSTIALGSRVERSTAPDGSPLPGSDTLLLWVRDTGTGIAAEDQRRIFERFGRAHPGRGQEGSGLGLAIVSAIAETHGGTAGVESEYGEGSRFMIRIPLQSVGARL